jgi:hypothetical protein
MRYKACSVLGTGRLGLSSSGCCSSALDLRTDVRAERTPDAVTSSPQFVVGRCRRTASGCRLKNGAPSTVRRRACHRAQIGASHVSARRPAEYCPNCPRATGHWPGVLAGGRFSWQYTPTVRTRTCESVRSGSRRHGATAHDHSLFSPRTDVARCPRPIPSTGLRLLLQRPVGLPCAAMLPALPHFHP